jgi:hypothetical protein
MNSATAVKNTILEEILIGNTKYENSTAIPSKMSKTDAWSLIAFVALTNGEPGIGHSRMC